MEIEGIGFSEIGVFEEEKDREDYSGEWINIAPLVTTKEKEPNTEGIWIKKEETSFEKKGTKSILLFFNLFSLGLIELRILEYNGSLNCTIKSKNSETALFIKENLPELIKSLEESGYIISAQSICKEKIGFPKIDIKG